MDVQASPAAWPELKDFLRAFQVRVRRPAGGQALARYRTGLRTALPHKHGDTMAQAVPGTSEQRRQEFLTKRQWEAEARTRQRVDKRIAEATLGDGVLVLDDTGVPQQGKLAVGVARQYAGTLGKVGQGQRAVTGCSTDPQAMWPGAGRLDRPQAGADDPARRGNARVPAAVTFQPTPAMAVALLAQARAWGVPHRGVVADADDGAHPHCLLGLEARQERSVVGGRADFRVSCQRQATSPSRRVDQLRQARPRWQGRPVRWRRGTQGWRRKQFVARRCGRGTRAGQRPIGWLLGERAPRGPPEERQDDGSNLPAGATVAALAG